MRKLFLSVFALLFAIMLSACVGRQNGGQEVPVSQNPERSETTTETPAEPGNSVFDLGGPLVRLVFEGGEAMVRLNDNAASRNFVMQLPMTQTFEDFNGIEKICRLPEELTTEGVETGVDPSVADITLYVPWNTLVFYYDDYRFNDDLIPIGRVESGMERLTAMENEFEVTMELVDENTPPVTEPTSETTNISMTVGETVITATLDNSETTQAFLVTLPRTLTMNQYGGREYYGRIEAIPENGEAVADFENGDVTYYPAGPSFAIFFVGADSSSQVGLIRMGRVTSDLSVFDTLGDSVEMLIEVTE